LLALHAPESFFKVIFNIYLNIKRLLGQFDTNKKKWDEKIKKTLGR
jgi:hypothetical protein